MDELTPEQKKWAKKLRACLESKPDGLEVIFSTAYKSNLNVVILKSGATERLSQIDMLMDAHMIENETIDSFNVNGYWVNSESY